MVKRVVRGIGYNTKGVHKRTEDGKLTHAYITWSDMFRRCYDTAYHERKPNYKDCTVAECWHDFQVFAEWYYTHPHYGLGYHLDKDIKVAGNKVYSPTTCSLVPAEINMAVTGTRNKTLPQGVTRNNGSFSARIARYGKGMRCLGTFKTVSEAALCYRVAKENYIHELAHRYVDTLETAVYLKLCNWKLIGDSYEYS